MRARRCSTSGSTFGRAGAPGAAEKKERENTALLEARAPLLVQVVPLQKKLEKKVKTARLEAGAPLLGQEIALHRERAAAALQQADAVRARL